MAKQRARPHQVRVSTENFEYMQAIGQGDATAGVKEILDDHKIGNSRVVSAEARAESALEAKETISQSLDQANTVNRQHEDRNAELVRENQNLKNQVEQKTALAANAEQSAASANLDKETAKMRSLRNSKRRRMWKVLFWVQLIAWPLTLAILDQIY